MNPFGPRKILFHSDRLAAWRRDDVVWPVHAKVDPSNACNHSCPDCIFKELLAANSDSLSLNIMRRLIADFADVGLRAITFSGGGEPLVNPHTLTAMQLAKERGIECGLITNGVLLSDRAIPILVDTCTWIRVSLDAASPQQHLETHGARPGDFDRILSNLRACVDYRNSTGRSCTLGAGYLTARRTMNGIERFAALGRDLGIDYVQYRPYHDEHILRDGWPEIWPAIFAAIENAQHRHAGANYHVLWTKHQFLDILEQNWGRTYRRCDAHAFEAVVGATGDVWFCCAYKGEPRWSLGNLHQSSFREIWQNGRRREIFADSDVSHCPPLCQLHQANKALVGARAEGECRTDVIPAHVNFL